MFWVTYMDTSSDRMTITKCIKKIQMKGTMQVSKVMWNLENARMFPAIDKHFQIVDKLDRSPLFSEPETLENQIECRDMTSSLKYLVKHYIVFILDTYK